MSPRPIRIAPSVLPADFSRLGEVCIELEKAGVRFRNEPESGPGGRQIQIEDPDGNPVELFEPRGR